MSSILSKWSILSTLCNIWSALSKSLYIVRMCIQYYNTCISPFSFCPYYVCAFFSLCGVSLLCAQASLSFRFLYLGFLNGFFFFNVLFRLVQNPVHVFCISLPGRNSGQRCHLEAYNGVVSMFSATGQITPRCVSISAHVGVHKTWEMLGIQ